MPIRFMGEPRPVALKTLVRLIAELDLIDPPKQPPLPIATALLEGLATAGVEGEIERAWLLRVIRAVLTASGDEPGGIAPAIRAAIEVAGDPRAPLPDPHAHQPGPSTSEDPPVGTAPLTPPGWDDAPEDPSDDTPEPITGGGRTRGGARHYRVNIKLVYWIPYVPQPELLTRPHFLPPRWKGATMSFEMRTVMRAMLASGNAPPPVSFPTAASWSTFVASNEYRAAFSRDLVVCCPDDGPATARFVDRTLDGGYTPRTSGVPLAPPASLAARLHADHQTGPNELSLAASGVHTDAARDADWARFFSLGFASDHLEDSFTLLREFGVPDTNDSFSAGEFAFKASPPPSIVSDCPTGAFDVGVRVSKIGNLVTFGAVQKYLGYQGARFEWALCCDTSKLRFTYAHATLPSQRIYIDNAQAWEYDMLTATWPQIEQNFLTPSWSGLDLKGSVDDLRDALTNDNAAPRTQNGSASITLASRPGCPAEVPTAW